MGYITIIANQSIPESSVITLESDINALVGTTWKGTLTYIAYSIKSSANNSLYVGCRKTPRDAS